jgi:CrcB protein
VGDEESVSGQGLSGQGLGDQKRQGHQLPVDPDRPRSTDPAAGQRPGRRAALHPGTIAVIALGGAAGTLGRVELGRLIPTTTNGFPWPTFAANITGAFIIGVVIVLVLDRLPPTRYVRPLIGTGFCGGLTTFSTLAVEIDLLLKAGRVGLAIAYLAASLAAGMVAVFAGMAVARIPITGRRPQRSGPGG